ncbi:MAG: glycosyltransferase family 2 protein [Acidimicrobiales bacterium]
MYTTAPARLDSDVRAQEQHQQLPTVTVVIPAFNEERNLPHVLPRIPASTHEVIVVDGHSRDDTIAVAKDVRPDVRVVHQEGRGKGDALTCGFSHATGDIIVMLDADGSTDPTEIPRFVATLVTGADFVKGSRFITGGGSADITPLRRAGNKALSRFVNMLFRTNYSDLCYGYAAFWRGMLPSLSVDCSGFEVETLMNVRAARAGMRVAEVPSYEQSRIHGDSNLNARRDGIRVLRTILAERVRPGR